MSSTVANYVGRSVDALAFLDADYDNLEEAQLTQALVTTGNGGFIATGIQKLAQRYLLELLTGAGSMKFLPSRGTSFMPEGRQGIWKTAADVSQSFNVAEKTLKTNLMNEELDTDPDDEKYDVSTLDSIAVSPDEVVIKITLVSQAGTSRQLIAPITVSPERTI
jgi:hypothetical protein